MKILVTEKTSEKGINLMREGGAHVDVKYGITREELLKIIPEYDAIVIRSVTKINEEFYVHATNIKVIGRAGNGTDNIEMDGATKRGIIVVNTPDANSISAGEHTIGLLISCCRNIAQANQYLKTMGEGDWDRSQFKGVELLDKTLGIVGLGRIGSIVATRMRSFGMKIIAFDPYITDERFKKFGADKCETLEDLCANADFITVHTPMTDETKGMIGAEQFKAMKQGVRVVNCARGGIINELALVDAINEGKVAAAGIDVLQGEPKPVSPLIKLSKVICTPHLGADTVEAQDKVGLSIGHEVISALRGEMVPNAVNLPTLLADDLVHIKPYLKIGERLGKLYYQTKKTPVEKVEVTYRGEVNKYDVSVITLAILKGLFEPVLRERVNYVNAGLLAEERGIAVIESRDTEAADYANLIELKITAKGEITEFAGSVFGKGDTRIVNLFDYEFDIAPEKYLLIVENTDKPGMIGQIGTLLGAGGVNVATMQVSRNEKKNNAMMALTVDSECSKQVLELIRGLDGIVGAWQAIL